MGHDFSFRGSNAERARSRNRQAVLGSIRARGAMGRAELARELALSTQAVSNIIADLMEDGFLVETGARTAGRGLPAMQYGINPQGAYALGVEIRPSALLIALLDVSGMQIGMRRISLDCNQPDDVRIRLLELKDDLLEHAGLDETRLTGVGIVMPGPFGETGLSGLSADLPGWQSMDIRAFFEDALALPVDVSNDANAAALAERLGGGAQGLHSYAHIYFGEGIGLGLVQNGQLMRGAFGNAGEIGLIPVPLDGGFVPLEECLSRRSINGFLDRYLDIDALNDLYLNQPDRLRPWMTRASQGLAQAVMLVENLFDPQTIFLGGAMPDSILKDLIDQTDLTGASVSNRPDRQVPRVCVGRTGRMTVTRGAASLILNRIFTPDSASL